MEVEIIVPERESIKLKVCAERGKQQRVIVATCGPIEHRDRLDLDRNTSRSRFIATLAKRFEMVPEILAPLIETQFLKMCTDAEHDNASDDIETEPWELWHSPSKDAYATILVDDHYETWSVRSKTFKHYVLKHHYDETKQAMSGDAHSMKLHLLEAQAIFDGAEHPVHVRIAEHEGHIYLDLGNDRWQAIRITPEGWRVIDNCPVRFRRSRGMLPLPTPDIGGSVSLLRRFINVDQTTWIMIVAWLVGCFRPRGPYPLLALFAEHATGKSTTGRLLRDLIDPNASPLRAEPKEGRDLMRRA